VDCRGKSIQNLQQVQYTDAMRGKSLFYLTVGLGAAVVVLALAGGGALWHLRAQPALPDPVMAAPNAPRLLPPEGGMAVYHLGHSLVGRDMPAMVEQMARFAGLTGHSHHSQLGWGASLRDHWYPDVPVNGFAQENDHPRFRPAEQALASGDYAAVVLTEMVELRDAIRWHASPVYFTRWVEAARAGRGDVRVYLYKSWHNLEHPDGWLERLQTDPAALWQPYLLAPAWAGGHEVHVIPVADVLAELTRRLAAGQTAPGLAHPRDLFARNPDGTLDTIHFSDQGLYLVALTHFAVLYHRNPVGLPNALRRADGRPAQAPSREAAQMMQALVWDVVRTHPLTGIEPGIEPQETQ
jgi:hypothetical protein